MAQHFGLQFECDEAPGKHTRFVADSGAHRSPCPGLLVTVSVASLSGCAFVGSASLGRDRWSEAPLSSPAELLRGKLPAKSQYCSGPQPSLAFCWPVS